MEQHPVPQNVTTFQFRLIGDMTIKQFGYLAGGAILAYISYKLPLPFFFSWPLAILFGIGGVGFAFVPVEERPMDVWVMSFIKNIYSPTQFIWSHQAKPVKTAPLPATAPPPDKPVGDVLQRIFVPAPAPATQHVSPFDWFSKLFSPAPKPIVPLAKPDLAPPGTPTITGRHLDISAPPKVMPDRTAQLQQQLAEVIAQRDNMRKDMAALQAKPAQTSVPPTASRVGAVATPTVKIITPEGAVKAGLPRLTTFPNVVTGITRDSDNNLLPGVLVTVRDKDGVPVRALKTNRLGQFAASTPITNGTYLVEIEDPRGRYTFDRAQVTLNGSIVPALEIIAKSQKEVAREKLAKEIFGN